MVPSLSQRSKTQKCNELRDRLYRSKDSQYCVQALGGTPEFPFQFMNVNPAPIRRIKRVTNETKSSQRNRYASRTTTQTQNQQTPARQGNQVYSNGTSVQRSHQQQSNQGYASSYSTQQNFGQQPIQGNSNQHGYTQQPNQGYTTTTEQSYDQQTLQQNSFQVRLMY